MTYNAKAKKATENTTLSIPPNVKRPLFLDHIYLFILVPYVLDGRGIPLISSCKGPC